MSLFGLAVGYSYFNFCKLLLELWPSIEEAFPRSFFLRMALLSTQEASKVTLFLLRFLVVADGTGFFFRPLFFIARPGGKSVLKSVRFGFSYPASLACPIRGFKLLIELF